MESIRTTFVPVLFESHKNNVRFKLSETGALEQALNAVLEIGTRDGEVKGLQMPTMKPKSHLIAQLLNHGLYGAREIVLKMIRLNLLIVNYVFLNFSNEQN